MRRGVAVSLVGLALTLAACGAQARTTSARGATARPDPVVHCTPKDLGIHFVLSDGAAGHIISVFDFVNVSARRCQLQGYPGASALTRSGSPIALRVSRDSAQPAHRVILAPHGRTPFKFETLDNVAAGPCRWSAVLRFIPPGDTAYEQIAHRQLICRPRTTATFPASVTPVGVPAPAAAPAASTILHCSPTDLGIHYVSTQGATGRIVAEFTFINVTNHYCRLFGYPGVSAFTARGTRIRLEVTRDALRPDHPVVLAPKHSTAFLFQTWDRAGGGPCQTSAVLRFIPPGDSAYEQIRHRQLLCRKLASVTAVGVT